MNAPDMNYSCSMQYGRNCISCSCTCSQAVVAQQFAVLRFHLAVSCRHCGSRSRCTHANVMCSRVAEGSCLTLQSYMLLLDTSAADNHQPHQFSGTGQLLVLESTAVCVNCGSGCTCRCNFGDVPPRVDAVKIYKNVGPEDQVITHIPVCTTFVCRLFHIADVRVPALGQKQLWPCT